MIIIGFISFFKFSSMTVFLMVVAENMPPTKNQLPLLGLFYGFTIVVVSCATAMTVLTLNIHHKGKRGIRLPKFLRFICFQVLARFVLFRVHLPNSHILEEAKVRKAKLKQEEQEQESRMLPNGSVLNSGWDDNNDSQQQLRQRFNRDRQKHSHSLFTSPNYDSESLDRRLGSRANRGNRGKTLTGSGDLIDLDQPLRSRNRTVAFRAERRRHGEDNDEEEETEFVMERDGSPRQHHRPISSEPSTPTAFLNKRFSSPFVHSFDRDVTLSIENKLDLILRRASTMADISEGRLRERELKDAISLEWQQVIITFFVLKILI